MIKVGEKNIAVVVYSTYKGKTSETLSWLDVPDVYLCIPENQDEFYKTANVEKILHPNELNRLFLKNEWLWQYFKGKADCIIKVDDDLECVRDLASYLWTDQDIDRFAVLKADEFLDLCQNLFILADDVGAKIFGLGNVNKFHFYDPTSRFSFYKAFDSSIMGYILEDKIKIDPSIKVKNEYDIQLQSLFHYGKMLVDNRYRQVQYDMFKNVNGGFARYRNSNVEKEAMDALRSKWGWEYNLSEEKCKV